MKNLFLICAVLFTTPVALADDIITETCANGAGTVIVGKRGTQYCMSNKTMNWWNGISWCDAQGRRLFSLEDCGCHEVVANCSNNRCPELNKGIDKLVLTLKPFTTSTIYSVRLSNGSMVFGNGFNHRGDSSNMNALCY